MRSASGSRRRSQRWSAGRRRRTPSSSSVRISATAQAAARRCASSMRTVSAGFARSGRCPCCSHRSAGWDPGAPGAGRTEPPVAPRPERPTTSTRRSRGLLRRAGEHARPRAVDWSLQRAGDAVASAKQHLVGAYTRAADPTPFAGVRPGAAAAAVAGCLAVGGGTTLCVTQGVDPIGDLAHVVSHAHDRRASEQRKPRAPRRRASPTPNPTPAATPIAVATTEPPSATPQPTAQPTPQPTSTPAPAPEEEYEPVAPATAASTAPVAPRPSRKPAPAPAGGPGEFDGP